jgi:murein DD-endopeptidase MepM/ murein hydrolase activator NlpD
LIVVVTLGVTLTEGEGEGDKTAKTVNVEPKEEAPKPAAPEVAPKREKVPGPWRIMDDATKAGHQVLSGRIGKEAFLRAIQDAGLPKSQAYRAYGALKGQLDLDHCASTDAFRALVTGRDKTLVAFEYEKSKEEVFQAKLNKDGHLEGQRLDLKVTRNQIRRAFSHDGNSFEQSARRAGFDPGIANAAEEALRGHRALSDFKQGDRIKIIAQEVTVLGEFSRYAGIEAMEIVPRGQPPTRIYYFPHPVEGGHFDRNGRAPYEGGWRKPITDAPRTSPFNPKRMHPVLKRVLPHNGTDFGAPAGTPIGATAPGVITFIGMAGRSGNLVKVKHDGGYESGYAHLSRFAEHLKVGDQVDRMQVVGYCGSTGSSTAPHLHFSMKKDGAFIDPESLNLDGLRVLPKSHRPEFALVMEKYDPILDKIPLPELVTSERSAVAEETEASSDDQELLASSDDAVTPSVDAAPAKAPEPVPSATAAAASPAVPAQPTAPGAIFISDAELLRMQSLTDDGEVRE